MSAISILNPKAEIARAHQALAINVSAAKGLSEMMKSNLGPKGTMKMLVSGAGDIKITKDGNVLLQEMVKLSYIGFNEVEVWNHLDCDLNRGDDEAREPTIVDGCHPRVITDGLAEAKVEALKILDSLKIPVEMERGFLIDVAKSSLRTKVTPALADHLAAICTDAVLAILEKDTKSLDLNMIEILDMQHRNEMGSVLVSGLVLDHGGRHPDMPSKLENCFILTCNVSLEYEKTEVNAGFFYSTSEKREQLLASEREFIDQRVAKIIELKHLVCPPGSDKSFVVINQKGIDPFSLDMLAKEGILGLRRAKRRNMERLSLACGGMAMNSLDGLTPDCLGWAGSVYEHVLGENKFTYVENCKNPKSVTILLKAPTKYGMVQMNDAIRDGLRALSNAILDGAVIPGAGAFELKVYKGLGQMAVNNRSVIGVRLLTKAILCIPKVLVANSGHDAQLIVNRALYSDKKEGAGDLITGLDLENGGLFNPAAAGIYDVYSAKRQLIDASCVVVTNLLLTDEIMRAGLSSLK
ncbi:T-complex protein 1 subunit zeta [Orchesella cincta]|uniref:T-complex protein 1 subunit zeta n=1 Tax=Orchesella cincta TaxID=48709 RepID=A0A1D2MD72_ORCCI|nr:T-complex protein 1 subunit zeta [Orchesella cincta]